jgi:hypothetical protein
VSRRVLIVSPHFPPINAADHQRVRISLPYLQEFGWEATVLAVHPNSDEGTYDPLLLQTVPEHIAVVQTGALPLQLTRRIGFGALGWRCLPYIARIGDRLLRQGQIDLVYFSTTVFLTMALGQWWHRRHGVPYVLDFQDPWLSDYYKKFPNSSPPGGRLKYGISQITARQFEPSTVRQASHTICVSAEYAKTLCDRYPDLRKEDFTTLPFGASESDFKLLPTLAIQQNIFDPSDGKHHWVYVGRGGDDMGLAVRALFAAIQSNRAQNPSLWQSIQLHFVGTSYAPKDQAVKTIEPLAQEFGIGDLVIEITDRISYFEALQTLVDSDAILLIGSNDPSYTASKLYPCILAQKPILAVFHEQSSVVEILRACNAGKVVTFNSTDTVEALGQRGQDQLNWLLSRPKAYKPDTNWLAFQPYTAREMTRKQCAIFDQCMPH